jgi:threonine dehydratase
MTKATSPRVPLVSIKNIMEASDRLKNVAFWTPLQKNMNLSERFDAQIFLKREDLQVVRSYKIRGAYHKMSHLSPAELQKGVVCASAGNHAQGVALACKTMKVHGIIFMPRTTPKQKVEKVHFFGRDWVEIRLEGDTFDDAYAAALRVKNSENLTFVHPFDDERTIEGQATVGLEILKDMPAQTSIDYVFVAIGGGGLASGLGSFLKQIKPETKIIGVEAMGAPAMKESLAAGKVITLNEINKFVDGVAVQRLGERTFDICRHILDDLLLVDEGKVCSTILELYNQEAIVVEPAGAITVAALDLYKEKIKGKNVVCVISGGNNDVTRMEDIKERSLMYEQLKHYFLITFPQRAGALRQFLNEVLGENDDITHFQYIKKNNRENGPAIIGIELKDRADYDPLVARMTEKNIEFRSINNDSILYELLI